MLRITSLTAHEPALISAAMAIPLERLRVQTLAESANGAAFACAIASALSRNGKIHRTGPNVSSHIRALLAGTSVRMIGNSPDGGPPFGHATRAPVRTASST